MADPAEPFVMHGTRAAIADGLDHVQEHVEAIERAVVEKPGLAFDLARTLVEITCRKILTERGVGFGHQDDLPRLFREVARSLPFLPGEASHSSEVRKTLKQTLKGLEAAVQGLCELRNACGFASHGSAAPRPALEPVQALLAARAADAIVAFLYQAHRESLSPARRPLRFEEHEAFNDWVDEIHGEVRIFESEFRPSEVLFNLEPETYRIHLSEFDIENSTETGEEASA